MKTKIISFISLLFIITTTSKAQEWEFVGLDSLVIKQLYVSGDTIWTGTAHRVGNLDKSGLYKSIDEGNSWTRLDDTLGYGDVSMLTINEQNTKDIWIIKGYSSYSNSGILYKTTDAGKNWNYAQNITQNVIQWFGISPFNKNEIYMIDATYVPGGILNSLFKSSNAGNSWKIIGSFPGSSHGSALAFAFDLIDSTNLYVVVDDRFGSLYLFKSTDKGESWFFVSTPPSWGAIYTDYFISNLIYLFPQPYVSNNGGQSWFLADSGFADTSYYLSYYQDKETTKLLYSLRRDGLYTSRNDTICWNFVGGTENLPIYFSPTGFYYDINMGNIFMEPKRKELFLGTAEGIYKKDLITGVQLERDPLNSFLLEQNFPNPFNPQTKIKFNLPKTSYITLKVYDILGNEIRTIVSEEKQSGKYQIEFDATGLTSGVYFYVLTAVTENGERINKSNKMILLK